MTEYEQKFEQTQLKRLKVSYLVFIVCCIMNTSGFCWQTFFVEEDALVMACYKPDWIPFYPFWFFQVLVMYFGVMLPIILLDTLVMSLIGLTEIQFMLLNGAVERVFDLGGSSDDLSVEKGIRSIVAHHVFLIE